jgi:phenylpropionate dioxygenase-like ring-hydroxylating dioxygenase large terminal subunit
LDGSLKSTPPAATPKERKDTLGLQRVPGVEVFAGMVFLNQQPNPPPLSDFLGDLPEKLIRYDLDDLELSHQQDYNIKGDWKLIAENFVDFYHINAVHPELSKFSRVDDHLPYQGRGQYIGFVTAPLSDSGGPGDSYHFNPFPRLKATETGAALFFQIFPNVSVTIYPHSVYTLMTFPTNTPGVTQERLSLLMGPTARKTEDDDDTYRTKCKKLMDFVVNINNEDVDAIENLQLGLSNARQLNIQGEFVPKYDWPVHRFQNMILGGLQGASLDETVVPELCNTFEQQVIASL